MNTYMQFADNPGRSGNQELLAILDVSGTMRESDFQPSRIEGAKQAMEALLNVAASRFPDDQYAIITFGSSAKLVHRMVQVKQNLDSLKATLRSIEISGATNITAGLKAAAHMNNTTIAIGNGLLSCITRWVYNEQPEPDCPQVNVRRVLLLSDGDHNTGPGPLPVANRLKQSGVCIDVIGIAGDHNADELNEPLLKQIASVNPDGTPRYAFITDTQSLIKTFNKMAHHIKAV